MDPAIPEAPLLSPEPRPSAVAAASATVDAPVGGGSFTGCPFLVAEEGGWRLDAPSRAHRCGAVSPPAPLSPEKQARLCLVAAHTGCATLQASLAARGARLGPLAPEQDRTTRWGLARTTTVIEESGGLRSRVVALLLDRGRWPAIPAVILVLTLLVLAASGLRPTSPAAVDSTPTPAPALTTAPTTSSTPIATSAPSPNATQPTSPTSAPTARPTGKPTAHPSATPGASVGFTTYRVKSGDTLSAIATTFGTTSRAIADLNGISVSSTLHAGQILKIPTS